MPVIRSISYRRILNSHVDFTNEFIVKFNDGSVGKAASSQGETISIYEDRKISIDPQTIIQTIEHDSLLGKELDQVAFDQYLQLHIKQFGRNNAFGLSEAFYDAARQTVPTRDLLGAPDQRPQPPHLCLNILNGGWHAYTNPVLSDFSEFMLVAKSTHVKEVIEEHNEIQRAVKERQIRQDKTVVSGNPVNCFATPDNREVVEFLLEVITGLGLHDHYDLMIDASAGDLWNGQGYHLGLTDQKIYSPEAFDDYWMGMIRDYNLRFLEDPFQEKDLLTWQRLTTGQKNSTIIGDNLYSSDCTRVAEGAANHYAHAVVIKPNQAGTVTAVCEAIRTAQSTGHIAITSHRSISTESTFLSALTCWFGIPYIKIGPLLTDYSSVVRLNEIIRLTEESDAC